MQAFSRFLVEKINRLALLKVKRIFAIEAGNLLDSVKTGGAYVHLIMS